MSYPTIDNKLLPFGSWSEHEVVNLYALAGAGTGLAGTLVELVSFSPDDTDGYSDAPVGLEPAGTRSRRYNVKNRIQPTTSGSTKWKALGIQLHDVREYDEHGNKLVLYPEKAAKNNWGLSGEAVDVLTRGIVTLRNDAYVGVPQPGYVGVVASGGNGKIEAVNPTMLSETGDSNAKYGSKHVVGKFLSSTGSSFNGYAIFKLEL